MRFLEQSRSMSKTPIMRHPSATESRNMQGRIRGRLDDGSLARVDGRAEEGFDPTLSTRAPDDGGEVRLPDPPRTARPVQRVLRSEGGDSVSRVATPRGTGFRREPVAGADERDAAEVLPAHGPRPDRLAGGVGRLGRDDEGRRARPRGSPVTADDEYLGQVRRAMMGMSRPVRDDILRELRGHIAESTAANGGNVHASLGALGSPQEVGRHYREIYGYGTVYKAIFAAIALLLGIPSVPVLLVGTETVFPFNLSLVFVIAAAAWILWAGVAAGTQAGILAGLAGMFGRLLAFGVVALSEPGAFTSSGGISLLVAVSLLLVLLGWIPGTAKEAWSGPRAEL